MMVDALGREVRFKYFGGYARQEGERIRRRIAGSDEGGLLVAEVILEVLGHAEGLDLLAPEDGLHQLVRGEVLLVLRVLKLLLLEVSPEPLDNLGPGQLLVLLGADNGGKLLR